MAANLVPTIESTALPSTPVDEWAASTTRVLHARAQQVATPEERPIPGAFPDELKPDPVSASGGEPTASEHWETEEGRDQDAGGQTLLEAARARLPAEDDLQHAMTSAGQAAKAILPEAVQAYLRAYNSALFRSVRWLRFRRCMQRLRRRRPRRHRPPTPVTPLPSLTHPRAHRSYARKTTRAAPESAIVNTHTDASVFSEIRSSSPMSEGYTPLAGTPAAASPHTPSSGVGAAGSRFMEVDLGLLHTTSPQPLSTPSTSTSTSASGARDASTGTSSASAVHEGMRAPHNTLEQDDVPHTPVGPGVPAAAPPPAPAGVIAPTEDLDTPVNGRGAAREEAGHAEEGAEGAEGERKRDRLVRRVKEKLHVGGHGQAEST
ncbi:hypothetical protein GGX14DRAFT_474271 [Mycena pura]|uniref:Uncharacterized protein n=1 Tax=Mycena pura TaxID=153505 RepID=A0AAD6Y0Z2_9AGAR|nr:hypothetical protein GGX14DRAFT_474271 [Mycena pura]